MIFGTSLKNDQMCDSVGRNYCIDEILDRGLPLNHDHNRDLILDQRIKRSSH